MCYLVREMTPVCQQFCTEVEAFLEQVDQAADGAD